VLSGNFEGNAEIGVEYFWPVITLEWFPIPVSGCPMIVQVCPYGGLRPGEEGGGVTSGHQALHGSGCVV